MLFKLACCAALAVCVQLAQAAPGVAAPSTGIGRNILSVNLSNVPATSFAAPRPAAPQVTPQGETSGLGFAKGVGDTYLIGAALGILDVAALHRLDHPVQQNTSGVWSIGKSPQFPAELIGLTLAGAAWEGGNTRLGRTLWQSIDAAAMAGISTQALKWTFQRVRPSSTDNPDQWFQGVHNQSFPSGDVSSITALVTPLVLEYHRTTPEVDALAALPVFDMAARMKAHGHWLTDTLAGAVVGVSSGYFAHRLNSPFILGLLPGGFYLGLKERFQ